MIDYTRGTDARLQAVLLGLPDALCGVVRAEVLHGARDPAHRQQLFTQLAPFQSLSIPDSLREITGDNLAALRRRGVTVPLPDAAIATLGIENAKKRGQDP